MAISTHVDASSGRTIFSTVDPTWRQDHHDAILSLFRDRGTVFKRRIRRYKLHIVHNIATNIVLDIVPVTFTNTVYYIVADIVADVVPGILIT